MARNKGGKRKTTKSIRSQEERADDSEQEFYSSSHEEDTRPYDTGNGGKRKKRRKTTKADAFRLELGITPKQLKQVRSRFHNEDDIIKVVGLYTKLNEEFHGINIGDVSDLALNLGIQFVEFDPSGIHQQVVDYSQKYNTSYSNFVVAMKLYGDIKQLEYAHGEAGAAALEFDRIPGIRQGIQIYDQLREKGHDDALTDIGDLCEFLDPDFVLEELAGTTAEYLKTIDELASTYDANRRSVLRGLGIIGQLEGVEDLLQVHGPIALQEDILPALVKVYIGSNEYGGLEMVEERIMKQGGLKNIFAMSVREDKDFGEYLHLVASQTQK